MVDNLIVLAKGATIYSGPTAECLTHFKEQGFQLSQYVNPFEFILDISTIDKRSPMSELNSKKDFEALKRVWSLKAKEVIPTLLESKKVHESCREVLQETAQSSSARLNQHGPGLRHIWVHTKRCWTVTCRDRLGALCSIFEAVVMGIVTGWIFHHVGRDLQGIRSRQGAMYTAAGLQAYLMLIFETYRLTVDIKVHDREQQDNTSSATAFVICRRVSRAFLEDIPVPFVYSIIFYFMAGFSLQPEKFMVFFAVVYLMHIISMNVATSCVALSREFLISSLYANTIFVMQTMAMGFFVNAADMSVWLRWMKWVSYLVSV